MSRLFENGVAYPCDSTGPYVDLTGKVVSVTPHGMVGVEVEGHGMLTGHSDFIESRPESAPRAGDTATIRVYDSGGGWYPDDKIMGWTRAREESVDEHLR